MLIAYDGHCFRLTSLIQLGPRFIAKKDYVMPRILFTAFSKMVC